MNIQIQKEETEGAASEQAIREALGRAARRRARLERDRARALNAGSQAPALTKGQIKTLAAADVQEAKALAVLAKGRLASPLERKAARASIGGAYRLRDLVGAGRAEAKAAVEDEMRLSEAAQLEALREGGEPDSLIERRRGQAQVRLVTRDGLKLAHERGMFTPRNEHGQLRTDREAAAEAAWLLGIGLRYRDRYEMAQTSLRSCLGSSDQVAVKRSVFEEAAIARSRAAKARSLRSWEGRVSVALGVDALEALRMVAGEARTVRSLPGGSRRRERLASGLRAALALIGDSVAKGD